MIHIMKLLIIILLVTIIITITVRIPTRKAPREDEDGEAGHAGEEETPPQQPDMHIHM